MKLQIGVLIAIWVLSVISLWLFVPKAKARDAHIIFLYYQGLMWVFALCIVQFGLAEYPIREFKHATGINFTMYYVFYPTYAVLMYLYYPERKSIIWRAIYTVGGTVVLILLVRLLGEVGIYRIIHWNLFLSFFTHLLLLILTRRFHVWFRRGFA